MGIVIKRNQFSGLCGSYIGILESYACAYDLYTFLLKHEKECFCGFERPLISFK